MVFPEHLILFFKKHNLYDEEMFNYFSKNTIMIDYEIEEQRVFIGCFYIFEKAVLKSIQLVLPYIYDEITTIICIHEIIHGIELYKKLNKKTNINEDCEVLPILYEKIYIEENKSDKMLKYLQQTDEIINKKSEDRYLLALNLREILYENYTYDIKNMQKMTKKLTKKYKSNKNSNI